MFCQNCGKKIEGGDLFCPFCGAKQQQVNPSENGGASFTAGSQKLTRKGLGIAVICVHRRTETGSQGVLSGN